MRHVAACPAEWFLGRSERRRAFWVAFKPVLSGRLIQQMSCWVEWIFGMKKTFQTHSEFMPSTCRVICTDMHWHAEYTPSSFQVICRVHTKLIQSGMLSTFRVECQISPDFNAKKQKRQKRIENWTSDFLYGHRFKYGNIGIRTLDFLYAALVLC